MNDFLDNVCGGHDEIAEVHPSLEFLGFGFLPELGAPGFVSSLTEASIKTEPEPFSYFEPETLYDETLNDDKTTKHRTSLLYFVSNEKWKLNSD